MRYPLFVMHRPLVFLLLAFGSPASGAATWTDVVASLGLSELTVVVSERLSDAVDRTDPVALEPDMPAR